MRMTRLLPLLAATLTCAACLSEVRRAPPELAGLRVWVDPSVAVSGAGAAAATESRSSRTQELADLNQFTLQQQLPEPGVQNSVDRDLYRAVQDALSDAGFRVVDDAKGCDFTARLSVVLKAYNALDGSVGRASLELREEQTRASAAYVEADVDAHTRSTSAWAAQAATLLVNRASQVLHLVEVARRLKSLQKADPQGG